MTTSSRVSARLRLENVPLRYCSARKSMKQIDPLYAEFIRSYILHPQVKVCTCYWCCYLDIRKSGQGLLFIKHIWSTPRVSSDELCLLSKHENTRKLYHQVVVGPPVHSGLPELSSISELHSSASFEFLQVLRTFKISSVSETIPFVVYRCFSCGQKRAQNFLSCWRCLVLFT